MRCCLHGCDRLGGFGAVCGLKAHHNHRLVAGFQSAIIHTTDLYPGPWAQGYVVPGFQPSMGQKKITRQPT